MYLGLDECCYSYASVPRNDTICVPEGEQVDLHCIIINPHDNFINLTVTWFRSTTEDMSEFNEIPATSDEYGFSNFDSNTVNSLSVINCSHELYRDTFLLIINHFTQNKTGYYWCQLSINDTLVQPSHHSAHFSIGECSSTDYHSSYYRLANSSENQCAEYAVTDHESDAGSITTYESSGTPYIASLTESSTRPSSVTQQEKESDKPIIYVAGSLSALVLVFGALVIVLSILYLCGFKNRETSKSQPIINTSISCHILFYYYSRIKALSKE